MRSLSIEKRAVYLSQPLPQQEMRDADGNETGIMENVWDEPTKLYLNVKPLTDEVERQSFGADVQNVLKAEFTLFDTDGFIPVEKAIAWIGIEPNGVFSDGDPKHKMNYNYTVEQVLDTGGQITIYLHKATGAPKA
jgi:hypothetical protein